MTDINNELQLDKNKNQDSLFNINPKNFQDDLIHFKNDILKDINIIERNISDKLLLSNQKIDEKLLEYEKRIESYNQKIFQISQSIIEDKILKNKIDQLMNDEINIKSKMIETGVKLENISRQFNIKIENIENKLNESIIYPNIIGNQGRFKTFHEFIDYILTQIAQLTISIQKITSDIGKFKLKIDNNIKNIKIDIENSMKSSNQYTNKYIHEYENKFKDFIKVYDFDFKQKKMEYDQKLNKLEYYCNENKENIQKEIKEERTIFQDETNKLKELLNNHERGINLLNDSINKFEDFINDINGKINRKNEEIKNKEALILKVNEIDENEIANKYLKGEISEGEFLLYKRFIQINFLLNEFLEKINNNFKNKSLSKSKNDSETNLISQINSCFNDLISKLSIENFKRRTVNSLLNCQSLKTIYKNNNDNDNIEYNRSMTDIRKSKNFDLNNASNSLKLYEDENLQKFNSNYKAFQMKNNKYNFKLINSIDSKINNSNIEQNYFIKGKDINGNINFNIENNKENLTLFNKKKSEKYINNNKDNKNNIAIKDKMIINKTIDIKKNAINNTLKNNIENNNMNLFQKRINIKEESKEFKIMNNKKIKRKEIKNDNIEQNAKSLISYKSFKGKKYLSYEKSIEAKIKENLIFNDIDYKDKMKKNREIILFNKDISFIPKGDIKIPKTQKNMEAQKFEKMIYNLQSYISVNKLKKKYLIRRNSMNHSDTKIRDNFFI
jgi:hypothetical protein